MKRVAESFPDWPRKLGQLRSLCNFFRNDGYRRHLVHVLKGTGLPVAKLLATFTANFAKWRYETIFSVLQQLGELRRLCQHHISARQFPGIQEKELLSEVLKACQDDDLWLFVTHAFSNVFRPLERIRRWGMVCACHYREGQPPLPGAAECPLKSRRLHEATAEIVIRRAAFTQGARDLRNEHCEESRVLREQICTSLLLAASELEMRFRYLDRAPWSFVQADTPEGAAKFLDQFRRVPVGEHDPLTQRLVSEFRNDLVDLRNGSECSERLAHQIRILRLAPLDESAGDGYHRATHYVKGRAPASTTQSVKIGVRLKENISLCRGLIRKHGRLGQNVFTYEWLNFKRILQTSHKRRFQPVRMRPKAVFDRVYREDAMARVD